MNQKSKWVRVDLDLEHFVCLTDKCGELVNNFHNINSNLETNLLPPFVHVIHFLLGKFDSFVACVASCLPTIPSLISQKPSFVYVSNVLTNIHSLPLAGSIQYSASQWKGTLTWGMFLRKRLYFLLKGVNIVPLVPFSCPELNNSSFNLVMLVKRPKELKSHQPWHWRFVITKSHNTYHVCNT